MQTGKDPSAPKTAAARVALITAALVVGVCATLFACRTDLWYSVKAAAAGIFVLSKPPAAAASLSASQAANPVSPEGAPSSASSAPAVSSSAAPSRIDLTTAAAQVSLDNAASPLSIHVSIEKQRVTVLDAEGRIVEQFVCSTGEKGSETPSGTFKISDRGESFYSPSVNEGGYYWTRFQGDYLFHSVPFDKNYKMEPEEAAKLGTPASHGCVRLAVENAKWIYDHVPRGTVVTIQ